MEVGLIGTLYMEDIMTNTDFLTSYRANGYVYPINVLEQNDVSEILSELEIAKAKFSDDKKKLDAINSFPHYLLPAFNGLISNPKIIEQVTQILGNNLVVWGASLFSKGPKTKNVVSWHQDLTYWDLDDAEEVTCWVALTPVSKSNGCMRFIPGSHKQKIVPHNDTFDENNMLTRGQEIAVEVDEADAVNIEINPGQASLHHGHLFHASGPNESSIPRIGFAIRYIKTSMRQLSGERPSVFLANGKDEFNYFDKAFAPTGHLTDKEFHQCFEEQNKRRRMLFKGVDANKGKRYQ